MPSTIKQFRKSVNKLISFAFLPLDLALDVISLLGMSLFISKSASSRQATEKSIEMLDKVIQACIYFAPFQNLMIYDFETIYNNKVLDEYFSRFKPYQIVKQRYEQTGSIYTTPQPLDYVAGLILQLFKEIQQAIDVIISILREAPITRLLFQSYEDKITENDEQNLFYCINKLYSYVNIQNENLAEITPDYISIYYNALYPAFRNVIFTAIMLMQSYEQQTEQQTEILNPRRFLYYGNLSIKIEDEAGNELQLFKGKALQNVYSFTNINFKPKTPFFDIIVNHENFEIAYNPVFGYFNPKRQLIKLDDIYPPIFAKYNAIASDESRVFTTDFYSNKVNEINLKYQFTYKTLTIQELNNISNISLSPDNRFLALSTQEQSKIIIIDTLLNYFKYVIETFNKLYYHTHTFDKSGNYFCLAHQPNHLKVYFVHTQELILSLDGFPERVYFISCCYDPAEIGAFILTDNKGNLWRLRLYAKEKLTKVKRKGFNQLGELFNFTNSNRVLSLYHNFREQKTIAKLFNAKYFNMISQKELPLCIHCYPSKIAPILAINVPQMPMQLYRLPDFKLIAEHSLPCLAHGAITTKYFIITTTYRLFSQYAHNRVYRIDY